MTQAITSKAAPASGGTKQIVTKRNGVGAGFGAFVGFVIGGPVGSAVGAVLGGVTAHKTQRTPGVLTPRRHLMFARAMEAVKDPNELRKLADAFAGENLPEHARLLYKRAGLRELPEEVKAKRRTIFRKAMCSDNVKAIRAVAIAFAREGAIDAGKTLKEHADAVEAAHAAGKSAKAQSRQVLEAFADKLARAVMVFGPQSAQAQSAARNLLNAQGKLVSKETVLRLCALAAKAIAEEQATVEQPPVDEEDVVQPEGQAETQPVASDPTGAAEPAVIGPQPAIIEPKTAAQADAASAPSEEIPITVEVVDAATEEQAAAEQAEDEDARRVRVAAR